MKPKFERGTEVFKRGNINFEGFVVGTFTRLDGEIWCFVDTDNGTWFVALESDLVSHKRIPRMAPSRW